MFEINLEYDNGTYMMQQILTKDLMIHKNFTKDSRNNTYIGISNFKLFGEP